MFANSSNFLRSIIDSRLPGFKGFLLFTVLTNIVTYIWTPSLNFDLLSALAKHDLSQIEGLYSGMIRPNGRKNTFQWANHANLGTFAENSWCDNNLRCFFNALPQYWISSMLNKIWRFFLMRFHNLFYLATIFTTALVQSCRHHFLDLECFSPIVCKVTQILYECIRKG